MEYVTLILNWISATFTKEFFVQYYPTILNGVSLICAYCLNNSKLTIGRWCGVTAAIGWSSYGVLIDDYSFFVANIIFLWIYASALYKFNRKRDQYKATFEEQKAEIEKLHKELDIKQAKNERVLKNKADKMIKVAERARKNLADIEDIVKASQEISNNTPEQISK